MHLIISSDNEERRRALWSLLEKSKAPIFTFTPENFTSEAFRQEVETFPSLSKEKQVIVHGIDQLKKEQQEAVLNYVQRPCPWILLYLTAYQFSSQSKLVKSIEKGGRVFRYRDEKPWEREKRLANWLICEAAKSGISCSLEVATALIKAVDSEMLGSELEKLICFVGDRTEITLEDINLISISIHHETLWQLGDALLASKRVEAFKIGHVLLQEGLAIFLLLAGLRSQFKTGTEILDAVKKGCLDQKFPYLKGNLREKKLNLLQQFGAARLQKGILEIFEAEIRAKNGAEPQLLLDLLIAKL